jgi:hypothetical protein
MNEAPWWNGKTGVDHPDDVVLRGWDEPYRSRHLRAWERHKTDGHLSECPVAMFAPDYDNDPNMCRCDDWSPEI